MPKSKHKALIDSLKTRFPNIAREIQDSARGIYDAQQISEACAAGTMKFEKGQAKLKALAKAGALPAPVAKWFLTNLDPPPEPAKRYPRREPMSTRYKKFIELDPNVKLADRLSYWYARNAYAPNFDSLPLAEKQRINRDIEYILSEMAAYSNDPRYLAMVRAIDQGIEDTGEALSPSAAAKYANLLNRRAAGAPKKTRASVRSWGERQFPAGGGDGGKPFRVEIKENKKEGKVPLRIRFNAKLKGKHDKPVTCDWDFGDGSPHQHTTNEEPIEHVYHQQGTYTVTLNAVDASGQAAPPVSADKVADPRDGPGPGGGPVLTVNVSPPGSGTTTPAHPEGQPYEHGTKVTIMALPASEEFELDYWIIDNISGWQGNRAVRVTMDRNHSVFAVFKSTAGPQPLRASATANPTSGTVPPPVTVIFSGSATGGTPPYQYRWNIEGRPQPGQTVQFTFGTPGTKRARLTVTDSAGASAPADVEVEITGPGEERSVELLVEVEDAPMPPDRPVDVFPAEKVVFKATPHAEAGARISGVGLFVDGTEFAHKGAPIASGQQLEFPYGKFKLTEGQTEDKHYVYAEMKIGRETFRSDRIRINVTTKAKKRKKVTPKFWKTVIVPTANAARKARRQLRRRADEFYKDETDEFNDEMGKLRDDLARAQQEYNNHPCTMHQNRIDNIAAKISNKENKFAGKFRDDVSEFLKKEATSLSEEIGKAYGVSPADVDDRLQKDIAMLTAIYSRKAAKKGTKAMVAAWHAGYYGGGAKGFLNWLLKRGWGLWLGPFLYGALGAPYGLGALLIWGSIGFPWIFSVFIIWFQIAFLIGGSVLFAAPLPGYTSIGYGTIIPAMLIGVVAMLILNQRVMTEVKKELE